MINQNCLVILFYNQWLSQINVDLLQPWTKNHTLKLIQWLVRTSTLPLRKNYIGYTKHFNKLYQFSLAWVQNRYEPDEAMLKLEKIIKSLDKDGDLLQAITTNEYGVIFRDFPRKTVPIGAKCYFSPFLATSGGVGIWQVNASIIITKPTIVFPIVLFSSAETEVCLVNVYLEYIEEKNGLPHFETIVPCDVDRWHVWR
jgi:hypothetical protein